MSQKSIREKMVLSGTEFELYVGEYLSNYIRNCSVMYNVEFFSNRIGRGTECDVLIITDYKIYCIECKNYKQYIKGEALALDWRFKSSNRNGKVANPVLANRRHIRTIRGLIYQKFGEYLDIANIICVPDSCQIYTECDEVKRLNSVVNIIENDCYNNPRKIGRERLLEMVNEVSLKIRR